MIRFRVRVMVRIKVRVTVRIKVRVKVDQIPDEGFLMTKIPMYIIVTVDKILLCLGVLLR
jgi:hypothetical protein